MKKVAVFGKPGSGKSTLSRALASVTGIPLHPLDSMVYQKNGELVERKLFDEAHERVLSSDRWIVDGFGPLESFYKRLESADTLIYIDLPYRTSYWLVTKRLLKGLMVTPEGWPEGSSVFRGSMQSYKVLRLCPRFWNEAFMGRLETLSAEKTLYVIRSVAELNSFVPEHISE
ncbi:adenylate kinase [Amphritea pacifica]|uniref:adenylate kinase n=2 Tax=Amphritea pacifica TaxID=2811233 RepID=UPI00196518CE|nr:adenylate kinase [Amphritea pacifica]